MQDKIIEMFDSIAPKYDIANRILSLGIDKRWRKEAIKEVIINDNINILDVACGTGDMIEMWLKTSKAKKVNICGLDPSKEMLKISKKKFPNIKFYNSYATDIPCEDDSIDVISISFGIRNVIDIQKAFSEFNRVLKKNGTLLILEFVKENNSKKLRKVVDFYTNQLMPKVGGMITNNQKAYEYLSKSIENFSTADELCELLKKDNFEVKKTKLFNFSQVALVVAKKR